MFASYDPIPAHPSCMGHHLAAGHGGQTALQAAAEGGYLEVVERLLAANANVNAAAGHGGRTALQAAAGHEGVIMVLQAAAGPQ